MSGKYQTEVDPISAGMTLIRKSQHETKKDGS